MREDRFDERMARRVVSEALGVAVELYDDNSLPRMVDALFTTSDGKLAALEVVSDVDVPSTQQFARLADDDWTFTIDGLSRGWIVSVGAAANIDQLVERDLLRLLGVLEGLGIGRYDGPEYFLGEEQYLANLAATHGLRAIMIQHWPAGQVMMNQGPWTGTGSLTPSFISRWVGAFLAAPLGMRKADKLRDHEGVDERHVFIWAGNRTDMGVQVVLEGSIQLEPDTEPPLLPDGISHVWVGGMVSSQGVVVWFPDRGWWRTPWAWPSPDSS